MKYLAVATGIVVTLGVNLCYFVLVRGPSKAEYVATVNPMCKRTNEALGGPGHMSDLSGLRTTAEKLAGATRNLATAIGAQDLPRGEDLDPATRVLAEIRASAGATQALVTAAGAEDLAATEASASGVYEPFKKAYDRARGFGLDECGRGAANVAQSIAAATPGILKNSFIGKAEAICEPISAEIGSLPEPTSRQQASDQLGHVAGLLRNLVAGLRGLSVSGADKPAIDDFLATLEQASNKLVELKAALEAGNSTRFFSVGDEFESLMDSAVSKGIAFGMTTCSRL